MLQNFLRPLVTNLRNKLEVFKLRSHFGLAAKCEQVNDNLKVPDSLPSQGKLLISWSVCPWQTLLA